MAPALLVRGFGHILCTQCVTPVTGDNWDAQTRILERVCAEPHHQLRDPRNQHTPCKILKPGSEFRGAAPPQSYQEIRILHGVHCMREQFCVFTKAVSGKHFGAFSSAFRLFPVIFADFARKLSLLPFPESISPLSCPSHSTRGFGHICQQKVLTTEPRTLTIRRTRGVTS